MPTDSDVLVREIKQSKLVKELEEEKERIMETYRSYEQAIDRIQFLEIQIRNDKKAAMVLNGWKV